MHRLVSYLLLLIPFASVAQWKTTPKVIQRLIDYPGSVTTIYCKNKETLPKWIIPSKLTKENHYLIKTTKGLFAGINGTGQLFQLQDSAGLLTAKRIDKSFHCGNSFIAINYSLGESIFSFGGYGYWKDNGLLRTYSPQTRDWQIIKTDRELATVNTGNFWLDTSLRHFYLERPSMLNEGPSGSSIRKTMSNSLWRLDMATLHWENLGLLNRAEDKNAFHAPWGNIHIYTVDQIYLSDYIHKMEYAANKELISLFRKYLASYDAQIHYMIDSTVYFGNLEFDSFDSIPVSRADFSTKGTPLCHAILINSGNKKQTAAIILAALLTATFVFIWFQKYRLKLRAVPPGKEAAASISEDASHILFENNSSLRLFTTEETLLLQNLYTGTKKGMACSAKELAHSMKWQGNNSLPFQEKLHKQIHLINQKWSVQKRSELPLVTIYRLPGEINNKSYSIAQQWIADLKELEQFK